MSLFAKLFGGDEKSQHYTEGLALFEDGQFAESAERLRQAVDQGSRSPASPLASFYLRQALVAEARRLIAAKQPAAAIPCLTELTASWDRFPDHQFLLGAAQGLAGDWDSALRAASRALRLNGDYTEARLLEACSLQQLQRATEAIASLEKMVVQGRWTDHWVLHELTLKTPITADDLPANLTEMVRRAAEARPQQQQLGEAVALCRAGQWAEGVQRFERLVDAHPRYPDYRVKLAAALYQTDRIDEALAEVERAGALNPQYRAAIVLKTLLLADSGRVGPAWRFLREQSESEIDQSVSGHEELLAAYLQGVLALLTGQPQACREVLRQWDDLARSFARAELLLAAADDLSGHPDRCRRRLATLTDVWPSEPEYAYFLALHHLRIGEDNEVTQLLTRWPAGAKDGRDQRPLFLEGLLAVREGRAPTAAPEEEWQGSEVGSIPQPAWDYLAARAALGAGDAQTSWQTCGQLIETGWITEPVVRLWAEAAGRLATGAERYEAEDLPTVVPQSIVVARSAWLWLVGQDELARRLVHRYRTVHPDWTPARWLWPRFWLDPIRRWLG